MDFILDSLHVGFEKQIIPLLRIYFSACHENAYDTFQKI